MEKVNAPDNQELQHEDTNLNEQNSQESNSPKDESSTKENEKEAEPNKSKKGHISDLNEKIENTERRLEEMNRSIMGQSIFDY